MDWTWACLWRERKLIQYKHHLPFPFRMLSSAARPSTSAVSQTVFLKITLKVMSQGRSDVVIAGPTASPIWLASKKLSQRNHTFTGQNHTRQGARLRIFKLHLPDESTQVPSRPRWSLSGHIGWYLREWVGAVAHSMHRLTPLCVCICRKVATSSNQLGQSAAELRDRNEAAVPHHRHLWRSDWVLK